MKKIIPLVLISMVLFFSCQKQHDVMPTKATGAEMNFDDELNALLLQHSGGLGKSFFLLPESDDFNHIPQDPNNPLTAEKVELGKLLFHETALAVQNKFPESESTFSCATCHHHQAGFQAGRRQGISDGGIGFGTCGNDREKDPLCPEDSVDVQPIRTPTIMNSAYQQVMLWNGQFGATGPNTGTEHLWKPGTPLETNFLGYEGVETQAIAGMTVHRLNIVHDFVFGCEYRELFDAAFPNVPEEERYTKITAGLAMAAYERTVLSNRAPFQDYLRGDYHAMTEEQKQGAILFFGKANCVACHTGPALNSMEFHAIGMMDLLGEDIYGPIPDRKTQKGRGGFTGNPEDDYKFKVPQLYGLRAARHFGHGSSFYDLQAVVEYKNNAQKENLRVPDSQLAEEFVPLNLSKREIQQLVAFLEDALNDKDLFRYAPESLPSGLCFPNNDEQSRIDLGCELPVFL